MPTLNPGAGQYYARCAKVGVSWRAKVAATKGDSAMLAILGRAVEPLDQPQAALCRIVREPLGKSHYKQDIGQFRESPHSHLFTTSPFQVLLLFLLNS